MQKKLKHLIVIFLCGLLLMGCFSSFAFAYEPKKQFDSEQFLEDVVVPFTLQYNATRQGTHDVNDIYDLLYIVFFDGSNYAFGALAEIINELYYYDGASNWSVAELMGMIWGHTNSMHYDTEMIALDASAIESNTRLTNSKLEYVFSAIEDTINIKWYDHNVTYSGVNTDNSNTFLNINTNSNYFYGHFIFPVDFAQNTPQLMRIFLPINVREFSNSSGYPDLDLEAIYYFDGNTSYELSYDLNYYFENTSNGIYLYIFGFRIGNYGHYSFKISSDYELRYSNNYNGSIYTIPFDTLDYQIIRQAFNSRSQNAANEAISKLADLYASDDYIAAKAAQQEYEDEALQDFTGSGDAAASKSDKNNLKDTSKAIKNGLSSGGSVSNGLSIFDNQSSIWDWFTQTTKDNLDETQNNPIYYHIIIDSNYRRNGSYFDIPFPSIIEEGFVVRLEFHFYETYTGNSRVRWRQNDTAGNTIGYLTDASLDFTWDSAPNRDATNIRIYDYVPNTLFHLRISYYDPENLNRSGSQDIILDFYNPNAKSIEDMLNENDRSNSERR